MTSMTHISTSERGIERPDAIWEYGRDRLDAAAAREVRVRRRILRAVVEGEISIGLKSLG